MKAVVIFYPDGKQVDNREGWQHVPRVGDLVPLGPQVMKVSAVDWKEEDQRGQPIFVASVRGFWNAVH